MVGRENQKALENEKTVNHFDILFNFMAKSESTKMC